MHFVSASPIDTTVPRCTPLVCLHQSPGSGIEYRMFQRVMAEDRVVLCPDTAGYGSSDGPNEVPDIEDYAAALGDALSDLGFGEGANGPVDLLGFHTGNFIALSLAAQRRDLVRRLVTPGIPYFPPAEREARRHQFAQPRPYFTDPDYIGRSYRATVLNSNTGLPVELLHDLFVSRLMAGSQSWFGFDAVFRFDADTALADVDQPVLLPILNETLAEPTRRAGKLMRHAKFVELPALTATSWFLAPEKIAAAIRPFLDAPPTTNSANVHAAAALMTSRPRGTARGGVRWWRNYAQCRFGQIHIQHAEPAAPTPAATPLVCLHQSPLSGEIFRELQSALATDRHVLCPDTPGFGASDGPNRQPAMADYGGAIGEALGAAGFGPDAGGPVDLFGFHTGSFIALETAIQHPGLVRRVVLCGVPYYPAGERLARQRQFLKPYAFFSDPEYVDAMYKRVVVAGDENVSRERRLERFTDRMRAGPQGEWGPRAVFAYDADQGFQKIGQPALLMAFDEVMAQPTRAARAFIPQAEFIELPDLKMMGFMTRPQRVADSLRQWLDT
jgi:pimeloyl-ACP methyl ester carboxylesterase